MVRTCFAIGEFVVILAVVDVVGEDEEEDTDITFALLFSLCLFFLAARRAPGTGGGMSSIDSSSESDNKDTTSTLDMVICKSGLQGQRNSQNLTIVIVDTNSKMERRDKKTGKE